MIVEQEAVGSAGGDFVEDAAVFFPFGLEPGFERESMGEVDIAGADFGVLARVLRGDERLQSARDRRFRLAAGRHDIGNFRGG